MNPEEIEQLNGRIERVLEDVRRERLRQLGKWGDQKHSPMKWLAIALEELGEAAKAALEGDTEAYHKELIETAAVCIAAVEDIKRETLPLPENWRDGDSSYGP